MTTLSLARTGRRTWTLGDPTGVTRGHLRAGRALVHAELVTVEGTWSAQAHGRHRRRVTAGPDGSSLLELDAPLARLPRREVPARWETSCGPLRYRGTLTHAGGHLAVRAGLLDAGVAVETHGEHPDLVVLAACFALLSRRHRDRITALTVAAVTSHGPR